MRTCLVALSLILAIEGVLAWASGRPPLSAMLGGVVLVGGITSFWKRRGSEWGWAPLVGLYVVGASLLFGIRECGVLVAVSSIHFVAWYYAARAIRYGAPDLIPGTLDGRPGTFAVAFYGALGLALLLVRGGFFEISSGLSIALAFVVFVLGLAVMEMGRFLRLREGAADRASRKRGVIARALALLALLAGLFFLFAKPVPAVADGLVKIVLNLQGKTEDPDLNADDMPELDDVPERDIPGQDENQEPRPQQVGGGQRAGDSISQTRTLPQKANLQGSHAPLVYVEMDNASQATAIAQRPIYVRSSTLGKYSEGAWSRVGTHRPPTWLLDQLDGREDGRVTLPAAMPDVQRAAELRYKIYVRGATGAGLLSLQGVSEFELPAVQFYDDDWYRAPLTGDVSYRAASRPLSLEQVLGDREIQAGDPGDGTYSVVERTELMRRVERLLDRVPGISLEERLLGVKQFMAAKYEYSPRIENPDGLDPLENFLFEEKRGYCDFYATTAALFARMMGVPSRIGYGFSKGDFDGDRLFTFHEDGAHAWTEIFLDGHGWVVFDVTPAGDGGDGRPDANPGAAERPDLSGFDSHDPDGAPFAGGDGTIDPETDEPESKNSAISDLVAYMMFCAALVAFAFWYFLKRDPAREAENAAGGSGGPGRKMPAYLAEFCLLLKSFGLDPQHGETLVEMLKSLNGAGVPVDGFEEMKRYHYNTRYADDPPDPKLEKRFLSQVRSFLKEQMARR